MLKIFYTVRFMENYEYLKNNSSMHNVISVYKYKFKTILSSSVWNSSFVQGNKYNIYSYIYGCSTGKLWCAKKNKKKRKKVLYNANKNDGKFHSHI